MYTIEARRVITSTGVKVKAKIGKANPLQPSASARIPASVLFYADPRLARMQRRTREAAGGAERCDSDPRGGLGRACSMGLILPQKILIASSLPRSSPGPSLPPLPSRRCAAARRPDVTRCSERTREPPTHHPAHHRHPRAAFAAPARRSETPRSPPS